MKASRSRLGMGLLQLVWVQMSHLHDAREAVTELVRKAIPRDESAVPESRTDEGARRLWV